MNDVLIRIHSLMRSGDVERTHGEGTVECRDPRTEQSHVICLAPAGITCLIPKLTFVWKGRSTLRMYAYSEGVCQVCACTYRVICVHVCAVGSQAVFGPSEEQYSHIHNNVTAKAESIDALSTRQYLWTAAKGGY